MKAEHLSRRERQIMDILFELGEADVDAIRERLPDPPTHTAVRTLLKILADKGAIKRRKEGRRHVYAARAARRRAGRSALQRVIQTFFDGSLDQALGAYLAGRSQPLSDDELRKAAELIREARRSN